MPCLLFLGCFAIYVRLMAPGIALEDSGEFATAAATLTLTHPPGYPLYLLVGRIFSALPIGSPGFRLALLSATGAALASVFVYGFSRRLLATSAPLSAASPLVAAGGALAVAFSPALAAQAVLADKYALNLALVAAAMYLGLRTWRKEPAGFTALAFLAGVALTHHMQILYLAPAGAALAWRERRAGRLPVRRMAVLAAMVALPLSLKALALPLCAKNTPSLMFGPLDTAARLTRYLSARDYSGRFASCSLPEKLERFLTRGIAETARQTALPAAALAVIGGAALRRSAAPVLLSGAACSALALGLVASFNIAGIGYYLLPVVAFLGALAAAGAAAVEKRFGRAAGGAAALLAAAVAAARGLPPADLSAYYGATDWGRSLLRSLAPGAVLVTQHDDDFYPPMYLQRVLGERRDVALLHRPFITRLWHHAQVEHVYPGLTVLDPEIIPWGRTVEPELLVNIFLRSHFGKREVAFTYLANAETAGGFLLLPRSCVFKLGRRGNEDPLPREREYAGTLRRFPLRSAFGSYPAGSRFREVAGAYAALWTKLSLRWWERGDETEARACLRRALRFPYTRIVPADLDRVRRIMGIPPPSKAHQ